MEGTTILVTGGAGFIGSHTCIELLNEGYKLIVVDSLVNSCEESLIRVKKLTGKGLTFLKCDISQEGLLDDLFTKNKISAVIHFAALKAVGESVSIPLTYYKNNIGATVGLLSAMQKHGCRNLVFSSSATVYGNPHKVPIYEDFPLSATNPYGRSKLMAEDIMRDVCKSEKGWHIIILRYFNPIGAHSSGEIGEDPTGIPNNLTPYILQVAIGKRPHLTVHGNDYQTIDGTGVRDYIHVVDLAQGHTASLKLFKADGLGDKDSKCEEINLGTGKGSSVLEMVEAYKRASGREIKYVIGPRRPGDIGSCYADCSKAKEVLGWTTKLTVEDAARDAWNWTIKNPEGYKGKQH